MSRGLLRDCTTSPMDHGEGEAGAGGGLVTVHMCDNGLTRDRVKVR